MLREMIKVVFLFNPDYKKRRRLGDFTASLYHTMYKIILVIPKVHRGQPRMLLDQLLSLFVLLHWAFQLGYHDDKVSQPGMTALRRTADGYPKVGRGRQVEVSKRAAERNLKYGSALPAEGTEDGRGFVPACQAFHTRGIQKAWLASKYSLPALFRALP